MYLATKISLRMWWGKEIDVKQSSNRQKSATWLCSINKTFTHEDNITTAKINNIMSYSNASMLKHCVDKLSKSTYPSLAPITVFVISGLQCVIYWKNFCHVWWVSYGLYVINCICTLMRAVFWHTCTFSGYINRLCRHTVESYCVSWIYCPIIC